MPTKSWHTTNCYGRGHTLCCHYINARVLLICSHHSISWKLAPPTSVTPSPCNEWSCNKYIKQFVWIKLMSTDLLKSKNNIQLLHEYKGNLQEWKLRLHWEMKERILDRRRMCIFNSIPFSNDSLPTYNPLAGYSQTF